MEILDYINDAKTRNNFRSDSALDRALGNKGASVCIWRCGKSFPNENSIEKLAILGGHDPDLALVHLHEWTTEGSVKKCYQRIAQKLASIAACTLIFLTVSAPVMAGTLFEQGNSQEGLLCILWKI